MALVKCKECGEKISSSVKSCPHCGKKRNSPGCITWIVAVFFGLIIISIFFNEDKPINKQANNPPQTKQKTKQVAIPAQTTIQEPIPTSIPTPTTVPINIPVPKKEESFISADELMRHCVMDFDAALEMGNDAEYYKNKMKYMNQIVTVKGIVFYIARNSSDKSISYISFQAGFPWAPDGNTIQLYPQENEKESFENIQIGQSVTIIGRFDNYGRTRQFAEQENAGKSNFKGSGYYARIKECKIAN